MKATLRRNGKHMITTRTTHHLDRLTLTNLLIVAAWFDVSDLGRAEEVRDLTRAEAETAIRDELYYAGVYRADYAEDHAGIQSEIEGDRARAWAERQVGRLWPETTGDPAF